MKIQSSAVAMKSERTFFSYEHVEAISITQKADEAAKLDFSGETPKAKQLQDVVDAREKAEKDEKKARKDNEKKQAKEMMDKYLETCKKNKAEAKKAEEIKTPEDMKIELMKRMLELLRRGSRRGLTKDDLKDMKKLANDMKNIDSGKIAKPGICESGTVGELQPVNPQPVVRNSTWVRTTVQSSFYMEQENTAFQSVGTVKTADGRSIDFNVTLEMSRSFEASFESFSQQKYFVCDPLVINADAGFAGLEDQKFLFDLDGDGKEEEISQLSKGSGFLALDKNGDGKINDGNELFGTKSGDGFRDLAQYDSDGNGWIDENDDVFNKLKLWTKDEKGEMVLMDLKKADVGAIYLGNVNTQFSLNGAGNKTNGYVRSTGVFLKESGGAGTVQHVDLTL
ncbi:MAG: hypothetical protein MJ124_03370 [Lachnospiraceae bacterium]|nr:hypothetical protein [Lachnospiraceae bacterium]